MVKLNADDLTRLLKLLTPLSILANERGRESVLVSANLHALRPQLDLSGAASVVVPLMINFFCQYGRLSYEQEALGRFLNTMEAYLGVQEQKELDNLISKYNLMAPVAKAATSVDWMSPVTPEGMLEKIIGENTLRPVAFFQQGLVASRSVAYIEVSDGSKRWSGTGFMISPSLLLTNYHVIPARNLLSTAIFRFNYQVDSRGNPEIAEDYTSSELGIYNTNNVLDYTLLELSGYPGNRWGFLMIKTHIPEVESRINIIQHPNGLPKQISFQNNFVKFSNAIKIQYVTSTLPGSSGSPIFNDDWNVVGIHHAGGMLPEENNSSLYFRNEGITMRAIVEDFPDKVINQLAIV